MHVVHFQIQLSLLQGDVGGHKGSAPPRPCKEKGRISLQALQVRYVGIDGSSPNLPEIKGLEHRAVWGGKADACQHHLI